MKDFLPTLPTCDVCAKGAIFVCAVLRQNDVKNEELIKHNTFNGDRLSTLLKGLFSADQLSLIENYFEGHNFEYRYDLNENLYRAFRTNNPNRLMRMKKIMQNIIKNKGTFIPEGV